MAFLDFKFPLQRGNRYAFPEGINDTVNNTRQAIKNILLTIKGARLNKGEYGIKASALQKALFSPSTEDNSRALITDIRDTLKAFLPEVKIISLRVITYADNRDKVPNPETLIVLMEYTTKGIEDAIRIALQQNT